jgi:hypothetical protein
MIGLQLLTLSNWWLTMRRELKFSYWVIVLVSHSNLKIVTLLKLNKKECRSENAYLNIFQTSELSEKGGQIIPSQLSFCFHASQCRKRSLTLSLPRINPKSNSTMMPQLLLLRPQQNRHQPHFWLHRPLAYVPINHLHPLHQWCRSHCICMPSQTAHDDRFSTSSSSSLTPKHTLLHNSSPTFAIDWNN